MRALRLLLLLGAAVWGTTPAAQSVRFLGADRYELERGNELRLGLLTDDVERLAPAPWPDGFDWFLVRAAGVQENLEDPRPPAGVRALRLTLERPGITLIGADLRPRIERMSPPELAGFLAQRAGPGVARPADTGEMLRVRRVESAKTLLRVLGEEGFLPNSATAQSKTGQRVEIRPLADPTSVPVKGDLPLRVYVPEKRGTKVTARHVATGRTQSFLTDALGCGFFTVTVAGIWTIEAHHAFPLEDDLAADWELHTATLTFAVPAGDPRQGGKR